MILYMCYSLFIYYHANTQLYTRGHKHETYIYIQTRIYIYIIYIYYNYITITRYMQNLLFIIIGWGGANLRLVNVKTFDFSFLVVSSFSSFLIYRLPLRYDYEIQISARLRVYTYFFYSFSSSSSFLYMYTYIFSFYLTPNIYIR